MHFLVTGHTGFKGAWLSLLLHERGHRVSGISLDPEPGSLFKTANLQDIFYKDLRVDIRDESELANAMVEVDADVLMHLAAQPLVRKSYVNPRETFETNVNGTLNVLDSVSKLKNLKACLIVTTDKVYKNINQEEGYVESDPLGGDDPYSASKAMADILTQSWAKSFPGVPLAIARAGNVIGGGDVCEDRLLPDIIRAFSKGEDMTLRYPNAVRPWQHVLDCVSGYLALVDELIEGRAQGEWNFGPGRESFVTVGEVAKLAQKHWSSDSNIVIDPANKPHEANLLALDSTKALRALNWKNKLRYPESLIWTLDWEAQRLAGSFSRQLCLDQISKFEEIQP